jgi:hypothetical protein
VPSILPGLTAAVVAVHAVLGCCWHHNHTGLPGLVDGEAVGCCTASGHVPSAELTSHRHDGADHPSDETGRCKGNPCVFLVSSKDHGSVAVPDDGVVPFTPILLASRSAISSNAAAARPLLADSPILPVRLHLAYQVFLI